MVFYSFLGDFSKMAPLLHYPKPLKKIKIIHKVYKQVHIK